MITIVCNNKHQFTCLALIGLKALKECFYLYLSADLFSLFSFFLFFRRRIDDYSIFYSTGWSSFRMSRINSSRQSQRPLICEWRLSECSAVGDVHYCKHLIPDSWFGFPTQNSQAYHPSWDRWISASLVWKKDKLLTWFSLTTATHSTYKPTTHSNRLLDIA